MGNESRKTSKKNKKKDFKNKMALFMQNKSQRN